ncbi:MAG: hypothetical protein Q7J29_13155 [Stagnimonas sp.]|nr:hypothetical protein [Stagnimonas sp.]
MKLTAPPPLKASAFALLLATWLVPLQAQDAVPETTPVEATAAAVAAPLADSAPLAVSVKAGHVADLADYGKTVVVPTAYVKFLVDGSIFVAKQTSGLLTLGGGSGNSVKAKAKYKVAGLDKALAQQIAKRAYDDFVAGLRAAGYTVLTYDDIKSRDYVASASRARADDDWGLPTESAVGSRDTYVVAAPSDEMAFKIGFTGPFAEFISMGKPKFNDATLVIPIYTITAPQSASETGGGFNRISAEVSVMPNMNLSSAQALWMGKPQVRMGGSIAGVVTQGPTLNLTEKAGELVKASDTTPTAANALSKTLSMFGGGSISSSSADYVLNIDREVYTAAALRGIGGFNTEVAKAVAGQ